MIRAIHGNIVSAPRLGSIEITENGWIVTEDGRILGVFDSLPERFRSAEIDDYGSALILQGFSDMHLHAPQYPMLGMGMDLPLLDWLNAYAFPTEARFSDPDYARALFRQLAQTLVSYGTTRVSMFSSLHTDATLILMEELSRAGVSGFVGKVNMDRNSPEFYSESTEQSKRETLRWLDGANRFSGIRPILTPRFTPSCTNELMAWLGALARERRLPIQSHLSESKAEIAWVRELHPDCERYWQTYEKYGLWNERTLMAHCVYSDETERRAMRDSGVTAVHCGDSNTNIASGVLRVRTMLEEGVPVALGSDIAGGAQLSMLNVMQMSIRISKIARIESDWTLQRLSVDEAYYLGTSAGAVYCGSKPGFAIGEPLHAVAVSDSRFPDSDRLTVHERFERALYLAKPQDIVAVYGNGKRILHRTEKSE